MKKPRLPFKETAAAVLASCAAAGLVLLVPASAQAAGCPYPAKSATATSASVSAAVVTRGHTDTVTVTVTSGAGTPSGTVALTVDGNSIGTLTLNNGSASASLPTGQVGTHTVVATFRGSCLFAGSQGTTAYRVKGAQILGRSAHRGPNRPPVSLAGTSAGTPSGGVLAPTGLTDATELAGLAGLFLIVAGSAIVIARRRSHG